MSENCGCCEGLEAVTPLGEFNRPGLNALAYRTGTHATFLETMKARLSAAEYSVLRRLTTRAKNDPSIALLDAWATVADVLTFYQERIANEGYLRTATERRSILELARLVGYVPRPGVAASVYLALTLEEGFRTEIPARTRAQSLPGPGELPQFFETSEALEARAEWNVLKPRLTRPQLLRPSPPGNGDGPPMRLYLKGVATNLGPNDPILIDHDGLQDFFRVSTVEPDVENDRTLVTLIPVVVPQPSQDTATTVSVTGDQIEDIRRRVDRLRDLEAHEVSPSGTSGRVVNILEELQARLSPETPPEEILGPLRETVLPGVRENLSTARDRNYTRLIPWLEQMESELQEIEAELSAAPQPELFSASASIIGPSGSGEPAGNGGTVNGNGSADNSKTPSEALEGLLEPLGTPPSVQPENAAKLPRKLDKSFGSDSDAVPQLLTALRPELDRGLYRAWERTGAEPSPASVYALRVSASPFGHNAPLKPILEDGKIVDYEEWTLQKPTQILERPFVVTVTVEPDSEGEGEPTLRTRVQTGDIADEDSRQLQDGARFYITFEEAEEAIDTITGEILRTEDNSFTLRLDFQRSMIVLHIDANYQFQIDPHDVRPSTSKPTIIVEIQTNGEFKTSGRGTNPTIVTLDRDESTVPTEDAHVVSLDASYKQVLPERWVVLERPYGTESIPKTIVTQGIEVRETSRADYGIAAKGTQIRLLDATPWINPDEDDFAVIRGTSVYAAPELLELADAPLEVVDKDGLTTLEPLCGDRIELDALYDGLKPGRWLFVTGEREDLPGVSASELVMLAGVTQEAQSVKTIAGTVVKVKSVVPVPGSGYLEFIWNLTIWARLLPDGSATGHAVFGLPGSTTGRVVQVVPPSGTRDFWCINVEYPSNWRNNFYIRDIGDGITSFDQIYIATALDLDCATSPDPSSEWWSLTDGDDFKVTDLPVEPVHSTLVLANDLAYCYKRETVSIYANVVNATHGETRPEVLGSGDGGAAFQRFSLKQSPLTHVAATTPSGVESTLEVYVNDVRWHEAEHISALQPTDRRYITQTDDEGELTVVFGDGQRGARLPTGVENVRAVYRTGIGKAGNVAEGQISLLATRPLGLKGVINPQPATGGADRETREGARQNAPLGVKVFDRLVSVRDYEDFARAFAGIGKASSTRLSDGRQQLVHLTIAGAEDIPIAETSDLYRNLLQALRRFGDPQQPVRVDVRELIVLIISAGVRLLPDHLWEPVEREIRAALLDTFGFERRDLGQDALLSEVISKIQHVPGVAYVDVDTFGGIPENLSPSEIEAEITRLAQSQQPNQRIKVDMAGSSGGSIHPAQLAFLTPRVPDTLILKEITA